MKIIKLKPWAKNFIDKRKGGLCRKKEFIFVTKSTDEKILKYYQQFGLSNDALGLWITKADQYLLVILAMLFLNKESQRVLVRRKYLPAIKQMILSQEYISCDIQEMIAKLNIKELDIEMARRTKGYCIKAQEIVFNNIKNGNRDENHINISIAPEYKEFHELIKNKKASFGNKLGLILKKIFFFD